MTDAVAVRGTRRTFKQLVDGTLRVIVDIEPIHAKTFLDLFGDVDMPVALAPLSLDALEVETKIVHEPLGSSLDTTYKEPIGPLCLISVRLCQDEKFRAWLRATQPTGWQMVADTIGWKDEEAIAKGIIVDACLIDSRRELDTDARAADRFHSIFRRPYLADEGQR